MRKVWMIHLLCAASILCADFAMTSCDSRKNTDVNESTAKINIPATTGLMSAQGGYTSYDHYYKSKRLTAEERQALKIDKIEKEELNTFPAKELVSGKEIYKGPEGRLATVLHVVKDYSTVEYLISYDAQGAYVDCIVLCYGYFSGDEMKGSIEGNTVKCYSAWGELDEWGKGNNDVYTITDDLHFKLFGWSKKTEETPFEIPFMTYETEDAHLFWNIASITCTRKKDGNYTLKITGTGIENSKSKPATERNIQIEPIYYSDGDRISLGSPVKVSMPEVGEGEAFVAETGVSVNRDSDKGFLHIVKK